MSAFRANPVRGPLNAATLRLTERYAHRLIGDRKRELFAGLPGTVVEVGPGTGANFRYYRPGTHVIAVEPNPHMHAALQASAARHGLTVELRPEGAERIGLPDGAAEAVVSTLVLCTVPDQDATVAEILRVLRPGGRLIFIEHVTHDGPYGLAQRVVARPWRWFFEGCDVRRDTERTLRTAGFTDVTVSRYRMKSLFVPINPQIAGMAIR